MRFVRVAAALLVCGVAAAQVGEKAGADSRRSAGYPSYQQANTLFVEKKFPEALNALDAALRLDPKLVPALTLKAKLAMALDRYDVARECLERAVAADPLSAYARFLYGFQFFKQNELPEAIQSLEKARQLDPKDPRPALYLGLAQESLGRTADALRSYREAIGLGEASGKLETDMLLSCSRLLLLLGDFEECGRLVARALKLDPKSRDAHFESARLRLKQGDGGGAAREGELALQFHTGDVSERQVHFLLIQAYQSSGREGDAARHAVALRALEQQVQK